MPLRVQAQPYVLLGTLSDLPNPASVPQAHLYHATDTGDCLILQIDPATGIRSWTEFCGATGITGVQGPALLNFAGGNNITSAIYFIANDPTNTGVDVSGISPAYPLARARTALNFSVNLRNRSTVSDVITVDFLVNGLVALTCTFPASASHSGMINVPGPASVPAGAVINVRVTTPNSLSSTSVSATIELF